MENEQNRGGWAHSPETRQKIAEKARSRWAAMSDKKRTAIGAKISRAKKGAPAVQSDEVRLSRAEKVRAHWASLTLEERQARGARAGAARRAAKERGERLVDAAR